MRYPRVGDSMKETTRRKYEEQIAYLEGEADYLERLYPMRYKDMIRQRRAEATRIKELMK